MQFSLRQNYIYWWNLNLTKGENKRQKEIEKHVCHSLTKTPFYGIIQKRIAGQTIPIMNI